MNLPPGSEDLCVLVPVLEFERTEGVTCVFNGWFGGQLIYPDPEKEYGVPRFPRCFSLARSALHRQNNIDEPRRRTRFRSPG